MLGCEVTEMILVLDVGNSEIKLGIFDGDDLLVFERIITDRAKTANEYLSVFEGIMRDRCINIHDLIGASVSCVVPQAAQAVFDAVYSLIGKKPFVIKPDLKLGIELCIDEPDTLGADLAVSCAAANRIYSHPSIVIGLGTATTFSVIDKNGCMIGGCIMPGAALSEDALADKTGLPHIEYTAPDKVIGKNTDECMRSGLITGTAAMIDGMCDRIEKELGYDCNIIATGGLSGLIIPHCKRNITLDKELTIKGLNILYHLNCEL